MVWLTHLTSLSLDDVYRPAEAGYAFLYSAFRFLFKVATHPFRFILFDDHELHSPYTP